MYVGLVTRCWHSDADLRPNMEMVERLLGLMIENHSQDKKLNDWLMDRTIC